MSADVLRQAAALMRERAQAATEVWGAPKWRAYHAAAPYDRGVHTSDLDRRYVGTDDEYGSILLSSPWDEGQVVEHAASWHPAVALAVADWLEAEADRWLKEQDRGWGLWVMRYQTKWDDTEPELTTSAKNEGQREADRLADDSCAHALAVARAYLGESA